MITNAALFQALRGALTLALLGWLAFAAPVAVAEEAAKVTVLDADALIRLERLLERGHAKAVVDELMPHVETQGDDAQALLLYGRALTALERHASALRHLKRAQTLWEAYPARPGALEVAEAVARATWMIGETHAARELWWAVLRGAVDGQNPKGAALGLAALGGPLASGLSAGDLRVLARAAWALGRFSPDMFKTALAIYEQAIEVALQADDALQADEARLELGELLLEKYNSAEATELFIEVLERHEGKHPRALTSLAKAQQFDGLRAAGATVDSALALDDAYVPALLLRALAHVELEAFTEAEAALALVFKVNRSNREGLIIKAAIAYLQDDKAQFREIMVALRAAAPRSGDHLVALAEIAARNRRYRAAAEFALIAANTEPGAWGAHALLGINRMRDGDVQNGRHSLEVAFRGDPYNIWVRNTLTLLDKMHATFVQFQSEHFVFTAKREEAAVIAPYLLPLAEEAFAYFKARYQHEPRTPIRIEMFAEHEDFSVRTAGLAGLDILGVSFGPVVALDSPSAGQSGFINWGSVLWHELAHTFHLSMSRHRVPRWFSEGLAVHEEHQARAGWGADIRPDFLVAYRDGHLPPASGMNDSFVRPKYAGQIIHGYLQGGVFMDFLRAEHGFEPIVQMLFGFAEGKNMATLAPALLGYDLDTLDARFDGYFRARFASELAALGESDSEKNGTPQGGALPSPFRHTMVVARQALEEKDLAAAEALLMQANTQFPSYAGEGSPYRLLAQLYEEQDKLDEAALWLRRNIDIDADDFTGHQELARLLSVLDRHEEAAVVRQRALYIDPFNVTLHRDLAQGYENNGEWRQAVAARRAVVLLGPLDRVVARRHLARTLLNTGAVAGARRELLQALEQAPLYEDGLELLLEIKEGSQHHKAAPANAPKITVSSPTTELR